MKFTMCDGCPCLNSDYEQGSECNLGYDSQYRRLKVDGDWHDCSTNCGLQHIAFKNGTYVPPQEVWDTEEDPPPPPPPPPPWLIAELKRKAMATNIFLQLSGEFKRAENSPLTSDRQ